MLNLIVKPNWRCPKCQCVQSDLSIQIVQCDQYVLWFVQCKDVFKVFNVFNVFKMFKEFKNLYFFNHFLLVLIRRSRNAKIMSTMKQNVSSEVWLKYEKLKLKKAQNNLHLWIGGGNLFFTSWMERVASTWSPVVRQAVSTPYIFQLSSLRSFGDKRYHQLRTTDWQEELSTHNRTKRCT